ncbi:hypothetical protein DL240_11715 [Lujinxingia litoralis]|uniref:Mechanosensitive ion channel protein MscS n=2 Tax=Lujinxingia litoralis TaxID=2211119 RepID=A0A328C5X2_9DELT|nr:hypothetical protein DL240_11715 [Lujinxingia litoralis]
MLLSILAALMVITLGGLGQSAAQPIDLPFTGPSSSTQQNESTPQKDSASQNDSASSEGSDTGDTPAPEVPSVQVEPVEPGLAHAQEQLEENYADFLVREPLHFDLSLVDNLLSDARIVWNEARVMRADLSRIDPWRLVDWAVPILIALIFGVLFILFDRQALRMAQRTQLFIHADLSPWVTSVLRSAVLLLGRVLALALLIALSYFPIQATFSSAPWTLVLTDALWWLLAYRAAHALIVTSLRLSPVDPGATAHYLRLERFALITLRISLGYILVLVALRNFGYRPDAIGFVAFAFRLTLALAPIYLFFARDAVLALLPDHTSSPLYGIVRRGISANYYGMLAVTIALLLFNAAGFVHAATFILARGYTLIVLVTLSFSAAERLRAFVAQKSEEAQEASDQGDEEASASPLYKAVEQWTLAVGGLLVVVFALRLLALYEPVVTLLKIPLLSVGNVAISIHSLLTVGLIVAATILSIRLFKAVLNAKIYPAFNVDVGVAYAVNTLINYALIVVAFVMSMMALGVQPSAVMVVLASLGVGIGFGLQNLTENLISGFILLFGRAVKKGDFISVNDVYGRVEAVGARSVVVRTPDNYDMLIPSKDIVSGRIINWTFHDSIVRVHIPIGVAYASDPRQVEELLLKAAARDSNILEHPAPDVWLVGFGDNSIDFELLVHFDCRTITERKLRGKFNFVLWEVLHEAGIEIPFPQRDVHLRSVDFLPEINRQLGFARHPSEAADAPRNQTRDGSDAD